METSLCIRGKKLAYRVFRGSAALPPVLMVSGWAKTKEEWFKLPVELAARGATCLVLDNPGVGESEPWDTWSVEAFAGAVLELADEVLGAPRYAVAGFSMGAFVAMELALQHPSRTAALVLVGAMGARASALPGDAAFFNLYAKTVATGRGTEQDRDQVLRYFYDAASIAAVPAEEWQELIQQSLRCPRDAATVAAQLKALSKYDPGTKLQAVRCPALVVHGARDRIIPAANAELLFDQLGSASKRLVLVEGEHNPMGFCPPSLQGSARPEDSPGATQRIAKEIADCLVREITFPTRPAVVEMPTRRLPMPAPLEMPREAVVAAAVRSKL